VVKQWSCVFAVLFASACFNPGVPGADESDGGSTADDSSSGSAGDPEGGADETSEGDATAGEGQDGPQLVSSVPANGETNAPLSPQITLYFDRIVSLDDAAGKLWVQADGGEMYPISPMYCQPDADPTCIASILPVELQNGEDSWQLRGDQQISIVVRADFPDPDGNVNASDQTTSFHTFAYEPEFFDDSDVGSASLGGLAYDPGTQALFTTTEPVDPVLVRKLPIPGGVPGTAITVAMPTDNYWSEGLEVLGGTLFVPSLSDYRLHMYGNLAADDLMPTESIVTTTDLPAPNDNFAGLASITQVGSSRFYGRECCWPEGAARIMRFDGTAWSVFVDGADLWDGDGDLAVAGATVDGVDVLFATNGTQLHRFDVATATVVSQIEYEGQDWGFDIQVDAKGRVWLGNYEGITVRDGMAADMPVIATRVGVSGQRIALREEATAVHVYCASQGGESVIGHLVIEETELQ
jgi:hypothetical protein